LGDVRSIDVLGKYFGESQKSRRDDSVGRRRACLVEDTLKSVADPSKAEWLYSHSLILLQRTAAQWIRIEQWPWKYSIVVSGTTLPIHPVVR